MASGTRVGAAALAAALVVLSAPVAEMQVARGRGPLPNIDARASRGGSPRGAKVIDAPGIAVALNRAAARSAITALATRLGLTGSDLASLVPQREYASASTGLRHFIYAQTSDGIPVFDAVVTVHARPNGDVVRVTSSAAPLTRRRPEIVVQAEDAAIIAAADVQGPTPTERPTLTWFPMDDTVRLAWVVNIEVDPATASYEIVVDAQTGERLLRRNRVRYAQGSGRVLQSQATQGQDPRRADAVPTSTSGCPPVENHELRDLVAPFRDPATVLFDTGALAGNNTRVFRRADGAPAASGTFSNGEWRFDFPFNSEAAAETHLFFTLNYAHDFFYDLGFDEASGNFQIDNFGRGGIGGDSVKGIARATGRNNATYRHAVDGTSPVISMFLFDGFGCWGTDTDGDGTSDLDADFDRDVIIHEFHHGVSLRLNTAFQGPEADAIGEGGGDFFAYSIANETTLAEYSFANGLRGVNAKAYGDWSCLLGIICEPHDNGEIWANVLWDVRERFRRDLVRGTETAAINESHQLYVDALKLSPPSPTMLDMRDSMLLADALRNPGNAPSENYCRLWESFAGRGMGVNAMDTAATGFNQVRADYTVPAGCVPPPPPPTVTVTAPVQTATEAGPTSGQFVIVRGDVSDAPLVVQFNLGGSAGNGSDYVSIPLSATIPANAATVAIEVRPIDDAALESNESVTLTLFGAGGYVVGTPAAATVTITSDDVAPDFVVSALSVPAASGAGATIQVTETTANQGTGTGAPSQTVFYLSRDIFLDASDPILGTRTVGELPTGASSAATTTVTLPAVLAAGAYTLLAKADGVNAQTETQESNNVRQASIRIGPDLMVSAISAPSIAGAGGTIVVTETTRNAGGGSSPASSTRFYLSPDYFWDSSDVALQARGVPELAPAAASTQSTVVTIPSTIVTGAYYLIARADGFDAVPEYFEANNTRQTFIRVGPDLTVTTLTGPATVSPGASFMVSEATTNSGGGAAPASTTRFFLSSNIQLDGADVPLGARAIGPLAGPGGVSAANTIVTMPSPLASGTYYVIAQADADGVVAESFETNNTRSFAVSIGPDLVVSSISAPARAASGGTIALTQTTRNNGAAPAGGSTTGWYLSTNWLLDSSDLRVSGSHAVPELAGGQSFSSTITATLPPVPAGFWYLIAVADDGNLLVETSESNNVRYTTLNIGPDLYVANVSVPTTLVAGSTLTLAHTIANQGAAGGESRVRFYLSVNNALDASDVLLDGFRDVPALGQGASSSGTATFTIPSGLSGSFYLLVVADGDGAIAESNELNNVTPRIVQITR